MKLPFFLDQWNLQDKRVLLRADLNVPLYEGRIADDYKLRALIPTLDLILQKGGHIILMTHLGRPIEPVRELSTRILMPWFMDRGYTIEFEADFTAARQESHIEKKQILLLENLRYYPGEKNHDTFFAQQLALLGDYYVDDAFGTLHRTDSSITLTPHFFPGKRSIGLLVKKELEVLNTLLHNPQDPFMLILGGGKVADKLPLIENLLDKVNSILLCPALVYTFLKAQGKAVGHSLIDRDEITLCLNITKKAKDKGVDLVYPDDYQVFNNEQKKSISIIEASQFSKNEYGISIGPKTINKFTQLIAGAGTIFFNASMGFFELPQTLEGTRALLQAVAQSKGFSVVGGGDSVHAVNYFGFEHAIDHLSTGGGATLAYLSGKPLPGLQAL